MSAPESPSNHEGRPAHAGRLPRDFVVGLFILGFCGLVYWASLSIKLAPVALAQNVQPATFPRMILAVIAALVALMMALSFRRDSRPAKPVKPMVALTAVMMVAFVIVFEVLGILAAMVLFCLLMPVLWGERRWLRLVVYATVFPAAVYVIFALGLEVYFAPGLLAHF